MYSFILEPAENGFYVKHCGVNKVYLYEYSPPASMEDALADALSGLATLARKQLSEHLEKEQKEFEDTENAK